MPRCLAGRTPIHWRLPAVLLLMHPFVAPDLALAADTADKDTVILRDVGVFKRGPETETPDPTLTSGSRNSMEVDELMESTTHACAHLGTVIGIRIQLMPNSKHQVLNVKIDTIHQPTINHFGQMQSIHTVDSTLIAGVPVVAGWSFEDPTTFHNGSWRFLVRDGDKKLLEQAISVDFDRSTGVS
jgi:hypothetical protein